MWTHLVPYLGDDKTAATIHRVARIGLWRAINLGRLIILAGSGVTRYHEHISWQQSLKEFIKLTLDEFHNPTHQQDTNNPLLTPPEQRDIKDQILMLCLKDQTQPVNELFCMEGMINIDKINAPDEQLFVAIDLCEELLARMGKGKAGRSRLKKVREEFASLFKTKKNKSEKLGGSEPGKSKLKDIGTDPIEAIFECTRTRRILTTNYDVEFEKWLYEDGRLVNAEEEELRVFEKLTGLKADCDTGETDGELPRKITVQNALSKPIISSSLDASNVGDLLNFASYSRNHEAQIFHLHGRCDRPQDLVVTQNDYRRIYAEDPRSDQAFQSAQEVLFAGNDVLMIGFGLGEEDVLRPFRQFIVRGRSPAHAPRRTFALLPTDTSENFEIKNAQAAVKYALNYEIYTIFFGGKNYRALMRFLKGIEWKKVNIDCAREKVSAEAAAVLLPACEDQKWVDVEELKTIVTTRALVAELRDLKKFSRDWWDAWRHSPMERRARYHVANESIAGKSYYLRVRHCMESGISEKEDGYEPSDWNNLEDARKIADRTFKNTQAVRNTAEDCIKGVRILRFTMLRGAGQGTLARLLHFEDNQRYIFGMDSPEEKYHGAFIAHLSFSMEFTSVIKALARFFAIKLAKWINKDILSINDPSGFRYLEIPDHIPENVRGYYINFLELVKQSDEELKHIKSLKDDRAFDRLLRYIKPALHQGVNLPDDKKLEKPLELAKCNDVQAFVDQKYSDFNRSSIARAIAIAKWEADQNLIRNGKYEPEGGNAGGKTPREHRLDVLRRLMQAYQDVVGTAEQGRLFVCLSGLERITDDHGDAYNPSHRALFRLLTDRDEKSGSSTPKPPVDLVLIAGRPGAPICYLSKEWNESKGEPLPGDEKKYSRLSRANRILEKWPEIRRIDWKLRARILKIKPEDKDYKEADEREKRYIQNPKSELTEERPNKTVAMAMFLKWARETDSSSSERSITQLHSSRRIHRLLWESNSLSIWIMLFWCRQVEEFIPRKAGAKEGKSPAPRGLHNFLCELDAIAGRHGHAGVIDYILGEYHKVDQYNHERGGDVDPELNRLILRHLALFALPIEAWVLLGCPKIFDHLRNVYFKKYREDARKYREKGGVLPEDKEWRFFPLRYWHERTWKLNQLKQALYMLNKRGLLMVVKPAADEKGRTGAGDTALHEEEAFLHGRYSLHNQLRQHLAKSMQLAVHEGADLNHHRMSIYCDQPRDIPSPSEHHFEMVRDIVQRQTEFCRKTLHATYDHNRERRYVNMSMEGWDDTEDKKDTDTLNASHMAAERVYAPVCTADPRVKGIFEIFNNKEAQCYIKGIKGWDDPCGIGGGLGHIHAAPQRLRAMLSLIQGTFSIGSLSRLKIEQKGGDEETPFDAYRSWISALLNLATSLERTREEISNVFYERLLQGDADKGPSGWLIKAVTEGDEKDRKTYERAVEDEKRIRDAAEEIGFNRRQESRFQTLRHPFYRDEIAWLYNERGLTSLTQGLLFDAIPLFELASFLMSHKRTPKTDSHAFHAAERRIKLNYSIAQIDRGNINKARVLLTELNESSLKISKSTPSEILLFSDLYLGVCDHLSGGHKRAEETYKRAIQEFSEKKRLRTVALSNRFYADLLRGQKSYEAAYAQADMAVRAASQSEQRDIEHLALVSKARIEIMLGEYDVAHSNIMRALNYSKALGLFSIEIDAKLAYANLMNKQGDFELAGQFSSQAIALSVKNGLRLRKLSGLITFAETRIARGSIEFSRRILKEIIMEAEGLGCITIASRAAELLSAYDDRVSNAG